MKFWISYILLIAWMVVIFILSSEGSDTSSGRSDMIVGLLQATGVNWQVDMLTFLTRKSAHVVAYIVLGVLTYNVARHYRWHSRVKVLASIGFVGLYAMSDEIHQVYVPGRSGELRDVLLDSAAGAVGVILAYLVYKLYSSRKGL